MQLVRKVVSLPGIPVVIDLEILDKYLLVAENADSVPTNKSQN